MATATALGTAVLGAQDDGGNGRAVSGSSPEAASHGPDAHDAQGSASGSAPSDGGRPGSPHRPGSAQNSEHGDGSSPPRADRDETRKPRSGTAQHAGHDGRDKDGEGAGSSGDGGSAAGSDSGTSDGTVAAPQQTLQVGQSGPAVARLQQRLKQVGYLDPGAPEDGVFSTTVQESVFRYQVAHGVQGDTDGVYGPNTRRALNG